ncbi:ribosomal protein L35AE/L33A [Paenibacillus dendritiformis]|uniref:50S ribosomal protein L33 n=1 Tax=Paenibacillus dendritiformis TaxID=130049 RepID=UPI0018CD0041|nr:50S ribosomal protein L33 [Paenibacillus dendritiformis]MBG9794293.1 ribosomal protein L35AE/L33A [Paenibacillus dendritiformis]
MRGVTKAQASKLVGKRIYALHKNGSVVSGKLIRISGNRLVLEQAKGKKVKTKAIIPLVLFDLLAIGTSPFAFGGFPFGFGGVPFGFRGPFI